MIKNTTKVLYIYWQLFIPVKNTTKVLYIYWQLFIPGFFMVICSTKFQVPMVCHQEECEKESTIESTCSCLWE
jgi:hypothetical protein